MRPKWWPLWLRRRFPGRWTQAEVDRIERNAAEMAEWVRELFEDEPLQRLSDVPGGTTDTRDRTTGAHNGAQGDYEGSDAPVGPTLDTGAGDAGQ